MSVDAPLALTEDQILTCCALRFDGHRYTQQTGFDHLSAIQLFEQKSLLPRSPEEQMCIFFMLQRYLMKWGGEREPKSGSCWQGFRQLYLKLHRDPVAIEYRNPEWYRRWQTDYLPRLQVCLRIIEQRYANAAPLLSLRRRLQTLGQYPLHTLPVDVEIEGTAFFPGGSGLWQEDDDLPHWPHGGIMILGQDFDSEASYCQSCERGAEDLIAGTWRHLLSLLGDVGVSPSGCFFTNFFMGVRKGKTAVGRHPDSRDVSFVERCRNFLLYQIEIQKPKAILILGSVVPQMLAPLSGQLMGWKRCRVFHDLDACGPLVRGAMFHLPDGPHSANIAAITHPSLRWANVHRRRYAGLWGDLAEKRLIRDALD